MLNRCWGSSNNDELEQPLLEEPASRLKRLRWAVIIVLLIAIIVATVAVTIVLSTRGKNSQKNGRQSPIDITKSDVTFDKTLGNGSFVFNYSSNSTSYINRTSYGWQVVLKSNSSDTLTASYLPGEYRLVQFHAHWSNDSFINGSEHLINGEGYAGEIHLVHYNLKYENLSNAIKYPDGLAVLGIFLNESDTTESKVLDLIAKLIVNISEENITTVSFDKFDIEKLIPDGQKDFFTYEGSMTTWPFHECVIWTIFRQGIPISKNQIEEFRRIGSIVRHIQPINGRQVKSSFKWVN